MEVLLEQNERILEIATGTEVKDALAEARKQVSEANVKQLVEVIKVKVAKLDSLKKQALILAKEVEQQEKEVAAIVDKAKA